MELLFLSTVHRPLCTASSTAKDAVVARMGVTRINAIRPKSVTGFLVKNCKDSQNGRKSGSSAGGLGFWPVQFTRKLQVCLFLYTLSYCPNRTNSVVCLSWPQAA